VTEEERFACDDPLSMLVFLGDRACGRRARLFAVACCRAVFPRLLDGRSRGAVEAAERRADGLATARELRRAARRAAEVVGQPAAAAWSAASEEVSAYLCSVVADGVVEALGERGVRGRAGARSLEARLFRDIFGNPFRPLLLEPSWRTPAVLSLGKAAYEERILPLGHLDPMRLAVLADALEELGAAGEAVGHLRSAGPHVRGGFVVDAVLSRE
jgi:hypothetical protein